MQARKERVPADRLVEMAQWIGRARRILSEALSITVSAGLIIVCLYLVDQFRSRRTPAAPTLPLLSVGSQLKIASVDFAIAPVSLVLVSSPTCTYCEASESFHAKLIKEAQRSNVPLYVVVPSRTDAKHYLSEVGFGLSAVREWKDCSFRPDATPTLVAVDNSGFARGVWIGLLAPYQESAVLKLVENRAATPSTPASGSAGLEGVTNYRSTELEQLKATQAISLIDVHERGFPATRPEAIVIPIIEVQYRAPVELNRNAVQVVDCSNLRFSQCEISVRLLREADFRVATLDAGAYGRTCAATTVP